MASTCVLFLCCLAWQEARVSQPGGQRCGHPSTTKGMTLTIVDEACRVTGGVEHARRHTRGGRAGRIGGLLGVQEFAATPVEWRLLGWLQGFGNSVPGRDQGTGSYGAGLARSSLLAARQHPGRRGGPLGPAGPAPQGQVLIPSTRSARPGQPCRGERRVRPEAGTGRWRRSGRSWLPSAPPAPSGPRRSARPGCSTGTGRRISGPGSTSHTPACWSPRRIAAPARQHGPLPHPAVPARVRPAPEFPGGQLDLLDEWITAGHRPRTRAAPPLRHRAGHRRHPADRGRRPPRRPRSEAAWATCAPLPRFPLPPGGPPGTGSTAAATGRPTMPCGGDRDHPDGLPPADPRLRRPRTAEGLPERRRSRCLKRYAAREIYPHLRG